MNTTTFLLLLFYYLTEVQGVCERPRVDSGLLFHCQLDSAEFFEDNPPASDVHVVFSASLQGRAGVPDWLRVTQFDNLSTAFLYGTPTKEDTGDIVLEVSARRMDTFEQQSREIQITINQLEGNILQTSELFITNYNMDEFLRDELYSRFLQTLSEAFQTEALATQLLDPSSRGIEVPIPPAKQGMVVIVTPGINITTVSMATSEQANSVQGECDGNIRFSRPPINFQEFLSQGFEINWCKYETYTADNSTTQQRQDEPDNQATPSPDVSRPDTRGSSISLMIVIVVVFIVIVMVVTGMACVLFGRRKKAFYVTHDRKVRQIELTRHVKSSNHGPTSAQRHLRDLAQVPSQMKRTNHPAEVNHPRPQSVSSAEEGLLEYQDVTDYENLDDSDSTPQAPPPSYTYPENLLTHSLQEPRRYRLITL